MMRRIGHSRMRGPALAAALLAGIWTTACAAASTLVAAASNFADTLNVLGKQFERQQPHTVTVTLGSTGKLYAQIINGAPYDIFLSADQARAAQLVQDGLGETASRFTYAVGRVAIWSRQPGLIKGPDPVRILGQSQYRAIAIANPRTAPYGEASRAALKALGLWRDLKPKIVMGQNIGQTFTLIASGNAELGFVAASQLALRPEGSHWIVPARFHPPIRQDGVLLRRARHNPAALAFYEFLKTTEARATIVGHGYGTE